MPKLQGWLLATRNYMPRENIERYMFFAEKVPIPCSVCERLGYMQRLLHSYKEENLSILSDDGSTNIIQSNSLSFIKRLHAHTWLCKQLIHTTNYWLATGALNSDCGGTSQYRRHGYQLAVRGTVQNGRWHLTN